MVNAKITKIFHRNSEGVMLVGDRFEENMPFVDFADMERFGHEINARHETLPYHIASAVIDEKNFVNYDLSMIAEKYP